jgi:hypothetical protein
MESRFFFDPWSGAIGALSASGVIIAVIWTRLYYIERKLDTLCNGKFHCEEHTTLHDTVLALKVKNCDEPGEP